MILYWELADGPCANNMIVTLGAPMGHQLCFRTYDDALAIEHHFEDISF